MDRKVNDAILSGQYIHVRRRIFRQLVSSMIFEGLIASTRTETADETVFTIQGAGELGESILYECHGRERLTFGRIRLNAQPLMRITQQGKEEAHSFRLFLLEVLGDTDIAEKKRDCFIEELEQTLLNDTLAQYDRAQSGNRMWGQSYDELESGLMDGHPYHPSYKSRIGFDTADNFLYGPEFKQEIKPIWLALNNEYVRVQVGRGLSYRQVLISELGEQRIEAFAEVVIEHGCDPTQYTYIPVHPWQWRKIILTGYSAEIHNKQIIFLGNSGDSYRPQQSIRTLANAKSPHKAYLKMSLHIINTSSIRYLNPPSVASAPLISSWLQSIIDDDVYLRDEAQMIILLEYAGVSYDLPARPQPGSSAVYGAIGCIWRESLHPYLAPGEAAVPFNALAALEIDGLPFIDPWIQALGVERWLKQMLKVCVIPLVHLLAGHGIVLESHAQNMVLIHRDGLPNRVALKDFHEGVEFYGPYLKEPAKRPDYESTHELYRSAAPNAFYEMDSLSFLREMVLDALFFMNLGELAMMLADHYQWDEVQFWMLVDEVLGEYIQRFPQLQDRFEQLDLFAPTCLLEQLTKRRLCPEGSRLVHEAANPLHLARSMSQSWEEIQC